MAAMRAAPRAAARPTRRGRGGVLLALALLVGAARPLAAQTTTCSGHDDVEVRRLSFVGNRALPDAELAQVVFTQPSSPLRRHLRVFGAKHCLDRSELPRDVARLRVYYTKRGFQEAAVDTVVTPLGAHAVGVTFRIDEGAPIVLDSITVAGLDSLPPARRDAILRGLDLRTGGPFDKYRLLALVDSLSGRLLDNGYPGATVLTSYNVDKVAHRGTFQLTVDPGHLARVGEVRIERDTVGRRTPRIGDPVVRRLLGLRPGRVYRRRDLIDAQRNLYATDAYRHVEVGLAADSVAAAGDSLVHIVVRLAEGDMHQAQLGLGWGTLDCVRAQGALTNRNFLGGARRLELTGRLSKIGVGKGTRGLNAICTPQSQNGPDLDKNDIFGDTLNLLNYYLSATFRQPTFLGLGPRSLPSVTLYSERRSEYKSYIRTTPVGGIVSFTREPWRGVPFTVGYQLERGRTYAEPAMYCAIFRICEPVAIDQAQRRQTLAVASASLTRDRSDNLFNPTSGSVVRLEGRYSTRALLSDEHQQFAKLVGDASWYRAMGDRAVFAARVRGGLLRGFGTPLVAGQPSFVPPQERLYAGGPNSVRGFRQNELGPAVYILESPDQLEISPDRRDTVVRRDTTGYYVGYSRAIPTGGDRLAVANFELRLRSPILPELFQVVPFVDVGQVWNAGRGELAAPKVTPGLSFRVISSFLGPIGVNLGYNPYSRPAGAVYYSNVAENFRRGTITCVSPGAATGGACPATYTPPPDQKLISKLTIDFSIGQAF